MFTEFLEVLPDLNYGITNAGEVGGVLGSSFKAVKISQPNTTDSNRTITGKPINRSNTYSKWKINITYNPMTKAEFNPVFNFLLEKRGNLTPFYISLPQYREAKDPLFANNTINELINLTTIVNETGGSSYLEIEEATEWASNTYATGLPQAGDLFTINSDLDSLHTKAYMITHVETHDLYNTLPTNKAIRIHFSPRLQKDTPAGSAVIFGNPLFKVTQVSDIQTFKLNTEGLYSFSLALEEAFY